MPLDGGAYLTRAASGKPVSQAVGHAHAHSIVANT